MLKRRVCLLGWPFGPSAARAASLTVDRLQRSGKMGRPIRRFGRWFYSGIQDLSLQRENPMQRSVYPQRSNTSTFGIGLLVCVFGISFPIRAARAQVSVTTYHDDPQRTGWNPSESILTPSSVTPAVFGLIAPVALDDQVDAQPLVVANQMIAGEGIHNVVYVATENNTVYAIDASTGSILKIRHFGPPVPKPLSCANNGPNVGINSTPTIDVAKQAIYVMAYTLIKSEPAYQLHALSLQTLEDRAGSPITVKAAHLLTNGSKLGFSAQYQRQRPALLESGGNVYAAFGSFCDFSPAESRGWLLGWNAESLTPLGANELTDRLVTAPTTKGTNFFLSAIWMAGYGVADDGEGDLFFVTGNSDPHINTYTGTTNIQESAVKMPQALTSVLDHFTPSNVFTLDQSDADYGSGGLLVVPDQPGPVPHLAVAAGKDGRLFIIDRDDMGKFHNPDIPAHVVIGGCWCGESYYEGSDGVGRVVSSGGRVVETWTINTSLTPALTPEASSSTLAPTSQDPGFFTTVSSNGTNSNTAVIWAIGRPTGTDHEITLYAFNGTKSGSTLPLLWSGSAGTWPNRGGDANLVPTVANGMVYVASYRQLAIFGLTTPESQVAANWRQPSAPRIPSLPGAFLWGTIKSIHHSDVVLLLRTGELVHVDLSDALKAGRSVEPVIGENVAVNGKVNADRVLEARIMWRAKGRQSWGPDRQR
jgi:PQQ enzyme repeat